MNLALPPQKQAEFYLSSQKQQGQGQAQTVYILTSKAELLQQQCSHPSHFTDLHHLDPKPEI